MFTLKDKKMRGVFVENIPPNMNTHLSRIKRFTVCSSVFMMVSFVFLVKPSFASTVIAASTTQVDELNTAIDAEETEVAQTTTTEANAIQIINQTNATKSAVLIAGIVNATAGTSVDLPLTLIPGPVPFTALQFDFTMPQGISVTSITAGPAATAAQKSVSFSTTTATAILFGLNQTPLLDGVVAIVHIKVDPSADPAFYSFGMIDPEAVDGSGTEIPLSLMSGLVEVH